MSGLTLDVMRCILKNKDASQGRSDKKSPDKTEDCNHVFWNQLVMKEKSTKRLRVLFISRAFPPVVGGIEKQNYEIYRHLVEKCDVTLVANRYGKFFLPLFIPYAIAYSLFRAHRYDVILLGDGVLSIVAWALRILNSRPLICCILHGLDVTYPHSLYQRFWVRRFMPIVDLLLPVSRQTAQEAVKRGIHEQRCQVIPNGVNPDDFTDKYEPQNLQRIIGCDIKGRFILLTVGRLVERKGVHWFVENVLPKLGKNILYIIAGDGPMWNTIERIVVKKDLQTRVFMLGAVSDTDLRTLYAAADVFVQPNIRVEGDMEGFGLVILEAGASGLPVIASRLEGLTDAVSENENGQLITSGDFEEYVAKIYDLVHDKAARRMRGQLAKNFVRQHFHWKKIADQYLLTFKRYLENRSLSNN
jgi:phosphatidylinositol alpha-1,6-mannosyltransferase